MSFSKKMQDFSKMKITSEKSINGGVWQGDDGLGCIQYPPCDPGPCEIPVFHSLTLSFSTKN